MSCDNLVDIPTMGWAIWAGRVGNLRGTSCPRPPPVQLAGIVPVPPMLARLGITPGGPAKPARRQRTLEAISSRDRSTLGRQTGDRLEAVGGDVRACRLAPVEAPPWQLAVMLTSAIPVGAVVFWQRPTADTDRRGTCLVAPALH